MQKLSAELKNKILIKAFLIFLVLSAAVSVTRAQINAPDNLEAEPENNQYIKVHWDDNSNNENGFYIERSTVNDTTLAWEVLGGVPQNAEQFFDYWVTNQVTYYYRVYAYAGNLRSAYSNVAYATAIVDTTLPNAPSNCVIVNAAQTSITIEWNDNANNENGFIIARRKQGEILFKYIDTVATDVLTYQDLGLTPDNAYFYKVCAFNDYGLSDFTNTASGRTAKGTLVTLSGNIVPEKFSLYQNFPNPFNPVTSIRFEISSNSFVDLRIYNNLGQEIENLVSKNLSPGIYEETWNAQNFTSGIYFYKITAATIEGNESFSETKRMILIK